MTLPAPAPAPGTAAAVWVAYNDAENAGDHAAAAAFLHPGLTVDVNGAPAIGTAEEDRAVQVGSQGALVGAAGRVWPQHLDVAPVAQPALE